MNSILDFSQPVDVAAFDQVVATLMSGSPAEIDHAQTILGQFQKHPDAFLRVDRLLSDSRSMPTRFFALQVLDEAILHRWNTFSEENRLAIRHFVMNLIVQECTSAQHIRQNRALLTKMNGTLVSIAKREWPLLWPQFIQDVCTSAGPEVPMIENNLNLLKLLGEEVLTFGSKTLTSRWRAHKKAALSGDFGQIMDLCKSVLFSQSVDSQLVKVALETLEVYVPWMSHTVIFDEQMLVRVTQLLVGDDTVRTAAVRCLTELCAVQTEKGAQGDAQAQLLVQAFRSGFQSVVAALPTSHSAIMERTVQLYEGGSAVDQTYVANVCMLLNAFLRQYYMHIAYDDALLVGAHEVMVGISSIYEKELFKSCVEYWWWLGDLLLRSPPSSTKRSLLTKLPRVLSDVRYILIKRMAKPEEVVIVEEDGEVRREHMADVEELQLYELMREALIFLTHLDPKDTCKIMMNLMSRQLDRSEWCWHNCNTLSWAVGAISMAMSESDESELFVHIIKGLLQLCKETQGKENRAVVASNVMFVVGQYPRYLRSHVNFLYTVVRKVFEFMHETFPGVQDMAVDTFFKLSKQCASSLVKCNSANSSFTEEVAKEWTAITSLLSPQQIQTCFAAVGCMVAADTPERRGGMLMLFLQDTNANFKDVTEKAAQMGPSFCSDTTLMVELLHYLRIYSSIASTCGDAFIDEMNAIIQDLYGFYRIFSEAQTQAIAQAGVAALTLQDTKYLRLAKREILRIFERFVEHTQQMDFVATCCMPDIFTVVLLDYENCIPEAKEAGALALVAACVRALRSRLLDSCAAILDHTFNPTVAMISSNMESYPEFRVNLFKLLQALNEHCFDAFINYASTHEDVLGGMLWAIKHTDYPTMSTGLMTLDLFLENVANSNFAEPFYTAYIQRIFVEVMVAAMDELHAAGFEYHCSIVQKLFAISDMVPPTAPVLGRNAILVFLLESLAVIPTLTESSITEFVTRCFELYPNDTGFRTWFADFLIEVKVWGAEQENRLHEQEECRAREETIPGFARLSTSDPAPNPFTVASTAAQQQFMNSMNNQMML